MKTAYDIIIRPVITEQSMEATELKKYVFLVAESANKTEIKKAVSEIFGVKVEKVTTIRMDGKLKRQGRYPAGRTASYKKAVVKLTADSDHRVLRGYGLIHLIKECNAKWRLKRISLIPRPAAA